MRSKGLLAVFLLGVGLCFLTVVGHGKVDKRLYKEKASAMHFSLLDDRATYIMHNPTSFLKVFIGHASDGETFREFFPKDVDTKGKIYVMVIDNRGVFSDKSGTALKRTNCAKFLTKGGWGLRNMPMLTRTRSGSGLLNIPAIHKYRR